MALINADDIVSPCELSIDGLPILALTFSRISSSTHNEWF